jgi:transcriptional regulator with PAS, ATPase and Fis domain
VKVTIEEPRLAKLLFSDMPETILAEGERIALKDLPASIVASSQTNVASTFNLKDALRQFEKQHILRALEQAKHDRKETAKLLDISLSSLYRKIEELEIT